MNLKNTANKTQGNIFLIPNVIGETSVDDVLPLNLKNIITNIDFFIVENIRNARRFLKTIDKNIIIDNLNFLILDKNTSDNDLNDYLMPAFEGNDIGLISEAGCPCIADPGSKIVNLAHQFNIKVVPISGPSSIFMALMASGLNGQNFAFNGYLPINKSDRTKKIKFFELRSEKENQTQIFIETPYRNNQLLNDILNTCRANTRLGIASEISTENEFIKTLSIIEWKKIKPDLNKKPSIFILHA